MSKKEKILITGGSGYIGSMLTPYLLSKNYEITVLDNFMFKQHSLSQYCINSNLEIINGDVRDESLIKNLLPKADIIIPLAAYVGAPLCKKDPFGAKSVNLDSQIFLLNNLSINQKLLMPITNSGYGIGDKDNFCDEESPLKPISLYGQHKVFVENEALQRDNSISFRLATVFGMSPRMRLDLLVNDFVNRACNDKFIVLFEGHFRRNFIHILDVIKAFNFGLDNFEIMKKNAFNVGLSSANLTKIELCKEIKKQIPDFFYHEAEIGKDPDKRDYLVSNKKIENLGYMPDIALEKGIEELIKGNCMLSNKPYSNI